MKKITRILFVGLLAISLYGCGDASTDQKVTEATTEATIEATTEAQVEWKTDIYKGIALQYPSNWKVEDTKTSRKYYANNKNFLVLIANLCGDDMDFNSMNDNQLKEIANIMMQEYESTGKIKVSNLEAKNFGDWKGFSYNFTLVENEKNYEGIQNIIFGKHTLYMVGNIYGKDVGNPYEAEYEKIINSIKIDDSVNTQPETTSEAMTEENKEENKTGQVEKINYKLEDGSFLKYKGHKFVKDYEGNKVIRIYFLFHNENEEEQTLWSTFTTKVFQNSVSCEIGITMDGDDAKGNLIREVQKGGEIECALNYKLNSDDGDITLKVKGVEDMFSDNAYQEQIIKVK